MHPHSAAQFSAEVDQHDSGSSDVGVTASHVVPACLLIRPFRDANFLETDVRCMLYVRCLFILTLR